MKRHEFNCTLLKERLLGLIFLKPKTKEEKQKINGEINYIRNLLISEEFSEERNVL